MITVLRNCSDRPDTCLSYWMNYWNLLQLRRHSQRRDADLQRFLLAALCFVTLRSFKIEAWWPNARDYSSITFLEMVTLRMIATSDVRRPDLWIATWDLLRLVLGNLLFDLAITAIHSGALRWLSTFSSATQIVPGYCGVWSLVLC